MVSNHDADESEPKSKTSRREVIRNTVILSSITATAPRVGATSTEVSSELDTVLSSQNVERMLEVLPGVKLKREYSRTFGKRSSIVTIPSNYGKLVAKIPAARSHVDSSQNDVVAAFYFDKQPSNTGIAWPNGTEARLTSRSGRLLLQRTATTEEKGRYLSAIDQAGYREDNTRVSLVPQRDKVYFTHRDEEQRAIEKVTAVDTNSSEVLAQHNTSRNTHEVPDLKILDKSVHNSSMSMGPAAHSSGGCDPENIAGDILWCISNYSDCGLCTLGSPAPPVAVACWIIICFDGGVAVAAEFLVDIGCLDGAMDIVDCLQEFVDEYADEIPFCC